LTARIPSVQTLADFLPGKNSGDQQLADIWLRVGKCIREFHDAGVWHADLNARNILLNADSRVFLIDFDRAKFSPGRAVNGEGNLRRLKRSLAKLWPPGEISTMQIAWTQLKAGYDGQHLC